MSTVARFGECMSACVHVRKVGRTVASRKKLSALGMLRGCALLQQALEPWRARGGIYLEARMGDLWLLRVPYERLTLKSAALMPTPVE